MFSPFFLRTSASRFSRAKQLSDKDDPLCKITARHYPFRSSTCPLKYGSAVRPFHPTNPLLRFFDDIVCPRQRKEFHVSKPPPFPHPPLFIFSRQVTAPPPPITPVTPLLGTGRPPSTPLGRYRIDRSRSLFFFFFFFLPA